MKDHYPDAATSGIHRHPIRVYYEDTDAGGIVYHATYLRFIERARTEALRDLGIPHSEMVREHGCMFVVRHVTLDYRRPSRPDDLLIVLTQTLSVGGASVTLRQSVILADTEKDAAAEAGLPPRVIATIRLACADIVTGQPARLPARWRAAIERLAVTPSNPAVSGREE
jgi:acyl-CoA thioester hydrolase